MFWMKLLEALAFIALGAGLHFLFSRPRELKHHRKWEREYSRVLDRLKAGEIKYKLLPDLCKLLNDTPKGKARDELRSFIDGIMREVAAELGEKPE